MQISPWFQSLVIFSFVFIFVFVISVAMFALSSGGGGGGKLLQLRPRCQALYRGQVWQVKVF
jgi:hypothetical protein